MLQLDNRTPYEAGSALLLDLDGAEIWVLAVKATYEIVQGKTVVADDQAPVCLADEFYGEPAQSSMKYENELIFRKPGSDVIINGHVYAPKGKAVSRLDAGVQVGPLQKTVRVHGDRFWENSLIGMVMTDARPFQKMPLLYERAFGGVDLSDDNPKKHGAEHRNPIGAGFGLSPQFLNGKPLPNLEDPRQEIHSWKDRPMPAGFGIIGKHWLPRRQYAGTYDQKWIEARMPLYPDDFDPRFFTGAHPDMVAVPHLRGGEPVDLQHMTTDGRLSFQLPKPALSFRTRLSGRWVYHNAKLASVIIEPDAPRVMMVWQSMLACHRKKFELEKTVITEKRTKNWH